MPGLSWRDASGDVVHEPDRPPPANLDEMPFPAWDLIDHAKYHTVPRGGVIYAHKEFATMFSSRACPWRCTYCHNSYGKTFRERSAEHVLAEIELLVTKYGVKELVFMDDIFNFRPERAKTIAQGHHRPRLEARADLPERLPRRHPRRGARACC